MNSPYLACGIENKHMTVDKWDWTVNKKGMHFRQVFIIFEVRHLIISKGIKQCYTQFSYPVSECFHLHIQ